MAGSFEAKENCSGTSFTQWCAPDLRSETPDTNRRQKVAGAYVDFHGSITASSPGTVRDLRWNGMALSAQLIKKLDQRYEVSSRIDLRYKGLDLSIKTNAEGFPVLLFIGQRNNEGVVKGDRYVRTLIFGDDGRKIKDHWELKGKAS